MCCIRHKNGGILHKSQRRGLAARLAPVSAALKKKQATINPAPQPCNSATSPPAPARGGPSLTWLRRMGSLSCMGTCVDGGRGGVLCADVVGSLQVSVFFAATSKLPAGGCEQAARGPSTGLGNPLLGLPWTNPPSFSRPAAPDAIQGQIVSVAHRTRGKPLLRPRPTQYRPAKGPPLRLSRPQWLSL